MTGQEDIEVTCSVIDGESTFLSGEARRVFLDLIHLTRHRTVEPARGPGTFGDSPYLFPDACRSASQNLSTYT
jgi:hypothetical protein